jgi:hypothetical protein
LKKNFAQHIFCFRKTKMETQIQCSAGKRELFRAKDGGAEGIRTPDPHNAIVVLYQLSYDPIQSDRNLEGRPDLSKQFFKAALLASASPLATAPNGIPRVRHPTNTNCCGQTNL